MATKPIITIDVDDSAFDKFLENFNSYTARVEDMSTPWQEFEKTLSSVTGEMEHTATVANEGFGATAEIVAAIALGFQEATKAQHEFERAGNTSNRTISTLAKTVKGLGSDIFGIATNILKMGAVGLGLGAVGGLFGFDALAGSALNRQRNSNSLGLTPGQLSSFQVNAQQFLGVNALSSAADAQSDVTKAGLLAALGIDFNAARKQSPSDLAFDELKAARAAWLQAQRQGLSPMQMPAVSSYLALGGSVGDIRNAAMAPLSSITAAQRATSAGAGAMDFDRATGSQWIELKKQLDRAGLIIETGLIKALAPLAPEIVELSKEFTGFITGFLSGPEFKVVIADVKDGLHAMGDFLTTTDWKAVGADVKQLADEIVNALRFLHLIPAGPPTDKEKAAMAQADATNQAIIDTVGDKALAKDVARAKDWLHKNSGGKWGLLGTAMSWMGQGVEESTRRLLGDYDPARIHALNTIAAATTGVPLKIMDRIAMDESGYGKNLRSKAGALGPYQFMPGTAADFGIDPFDTRAASGAAAKKLAAAFKKYGSWDKAVAAYNWGEGNLDDDLKAHGKDWLRYAPAETQGEVSNVTGHGGGSMDDSIAKALSKYTKAVTRTSGKPVKVSVTNNTAARVAVSVNAAALA